MYNKQHVENTFISQAMLRDIYVAFPEIKTFGWVLILAYVAAILGTVGAYYYGKEHMLLSMKNIMIFIGGLVIYHMLVSRIFKRIANRKRTLFTALKMQEFDKLFNMHNKIKFLTSEYNGKFVILDGVEAVHSDKDLALFEVYLKAAELGGNAIVCAQIAISNNTQGYNTVSTSHSFNTVNVRGGGRTWTNTTYHVTGTVIKISD